MRHSFKFWIERFKDKSPPEAVSNWIWQSLQAAPLMEWIPRQMSFADYLLKSHYFAGDALRRVEIPELQQICPILGIVLRREETRKRNLLLKRLESERTHINGMLNFPFVRQAILEVLKERGRKEREKLSKESGAADPLQPQNAAEDLLDAPVWWTDDSEEPGW
jgi:hypothetical protein